MQSQPQNANVYFSEKEFYLFARTIMISKQLLIKSTVNILMTYNLSETLYN